MKRGFIFAGQGQQFLFMGKDLADAYPLIKDIYQKAHGILGYDLLSLSSDQLSQTRYTQPALYTLGYGIGELLSQMGFEADVCAGLSLGEYNALTYAHSISFEDGLRVIQKRGEIMQDAFKPYETGMAACVKTTQANVSKLIKDTAIEICNINTPSQIIIGGYTADLQALRPRLKEAGIKVIPLKVATVSHMSYLKPASTILNKVLNAVTFNTPRLPFINNVDAQIQTSHFVETLTRQLYEPTQLAKIIDYMDKAGVTQFIEVGPKGAIASCIKEICGEDSDVHTLYNLETFRRYCDGT